MWEYLFPWQKDWINAAGQDTSLYATVTLQSNYVTWADTI